MDRILDQLSFHPLFALVAVSIFVAGLVLGALRRSEGPALLPKMTALALLAGSFGIASSVRTLINVFQAMVVAGSGGVGTVAAGFAEGEWICLLGMSSAFLTLAVGLIFARGGAAAGPGGALKPMPSWIPALLTVLAAAVVALSLHRDWLLRFATSIAFLPKGAQVPGSVGEVSQRIANHLTFLALAGHGMILACAALLVALFAAGRRSLSARQTLWIRLLAALLLVLALIGTVALWRQFNYFVEVAMTGQPLSATIIP